MAYRVQIVRERNGHVCQTSVFNVTEATREAAKLPSTKKEFEALTDDQRSELRSNLEAVVRTKVPEGGYLYIAELHWWSGRARSIQFREI